MDVTAIIPTSGHRPGMLQQAIQSVWAQTHAPAELIVVADGDDDLRQSVCDGMAGAHLEHTRVVCTGIQGGAGVSHARNVGATIARTGYLAFLDDDDLWLPVFLSVLGKDEPDLALGAFVKERCDGTRVPEKTPPTTLHPRRFLVTNPGLRGSNLVIRRHLYESAGGFNPLLRTLNDLDFGIRVSQMAGIKYQPVCERLVVFRAHGGARITRAGCPDIRDGVTMFWRLHSFRMSDLDRTRFRERARMLWDVDPISPADRVYHGASSATVGGPDLPNTPTASVAGGTLDMMVAAIVARAEAEPRPDSPLPERFLEWTRDWLSTQPASFIWIMGLPGVGKSTLLRACRHIDVDALTLELADVVRASTGGVSPPQPGGLQALGNAARAIQRVVRPMHRRILVACTSLPASALAEGGGHCVVLLHAPRWRVEQQLQARPARFRRSASPAELPMYYSQQQALASDRVLLHLEVPYFRELLGKPTE